MTRKALALSGAVEGPLDEAVLRRLTQHLGLELGTVYGKNGKHAIRDHMAGYNNAARFSPWCVLVDLDDDAPCPGELRQQWLPSPAEHMRFRIAVREVESWVLADRERIARFLGVAPALVPENPEGLDDPKRVLVDLAARSRSGDIRHGLAPRSGSGRAVGPTYSAQLMEFVEDRLHGWRPGIAAEKAASLSRCLNRLAEFLGGRP